MICLGDSLTLGIGSPELDKWPLRVALALEKEWPGAYDLYIRAWNGGTTTDALNKVEGEVGYLLPGIVLIALGVNDALVRKIRQTALVGVEDFRTNLEELNRFVVARGGQTIFIVQHVPEPDERPADRRYYVAGNGKTYRENYEPYCRVVNEVGAKGNIPVIDIPALLENEGTKSAALVIDDGLHLSSEGNATYARLVFRRLREILPTLAPARA